MRYVNRTSYFVPRSSSHHPIMANHFRSLRQNRGHRISDSDHTDRARSPPQPPQPPSYLFPTDNSIFAIYSPCLDPANFSPYRIASGEANRAEQHDHASTHHPCHERRRDLRCVGIPARAVCPPLLATRLPTPFFRRRGFSLALVVARDGRGGGSAAD